MSNDTKTIRVNGMRPTWSNLGVVLLFVAASAGWFVGYGKFSEKISNLDGDFISIATRLQKVEIWQKDWPTEGELMMDREQNTQLKDLTRRIERIEHDVN